MKITGTIIVFLTYLATYSFAQNAEQKSISVKKINRTVTIDGILKEPFWKSNQPAKDFFQHFPSDSTSAIKDTEVFFAFDKNNLYIAIRCFSKGNDFITPSLRRDYQDDGNDNFNIILDTYQDQSNAFVFGINPFGVKREGLIINGGNEAKDFSLVWDNKWEAKTVVAEAYWMAEMKIPFSTLRFDPKKDKWNFNCYRTNTKTNEQTSFVRVPRNQPIFNLAFHSKLNFETYLPKSAHSISVIPYTSSSFLNENKSPSEKKKFGLRSGVDARVALTSGLNLNLTINPDFSQVEVDHQRTNLSRFEVSFPEQRQFFLEDQDLFGNFGSSKINPFFSRRIGLTTDSITGNLKSNPILAGVRLSGKLDDDWRVGFLSTQTGFSRPDQQYGYNYSAISVRKKVFHQSFLSLLFANRQLIGKRPNQTTFDQPSRVAAIEYNLATPSNKWAGKIFYQHNFRPEKNYQFPIAQGAEITYKKRRFSIEWLHQYVNKNFNPLTGFVPRSNFFRLNPNTQFHFYNKNGLIVEHSPGVEINKIFQKNIGLTDDDYEIFYQLKFKNNQELTFKYDQQDFFLFEPFDPLGLGGAPVLDSLYYFRNGFSIDFKSDPRKKFSYRINTNRGDYFGGNLFEIKADLLLRLQPYGAFSIETDITKINLSEPLSDGILYLISPRVDLTFTKKLFFTTFIQYNSQIDNLNINSRLQWRFAPVSDFFLVYTENFHPDDLNTKGRSIVAKLTYWLNL